MAGKVRHSHCHCGAIQFEAELPDPLRAGRCNCSICAMKGVAMVHVPLEALTVTKGEDVLACYRFGTGEAKHYFCPICGIHCFHQLRSDPHLYGINAACIEGVRAYEDFPDINVNDGQRHARDNDGVTRSAGRLKFVPAGE
jgi:hypothetical protein